MAATASQDDIVQILASLKLHGVKHVALTTIEGRSLGSTLTESAPRFKLGALSAASVAIATKTSGELDLGQFDQIQIMSSNGSLFLGAVGNKAFLSVVTERAVDRNHLINEMNRVAQQLGALV